METPSNELQVMLRLLICDRETALAMVEAALRDNPALSLQPDLPEVAAFPREREVDVEIVQTSGSLGIRMAQMPALVVADENEDDDGNAADRERATWLVSALEKRVDAIRKVTEVILRDARPYFTGERPTPEAVSFTQVAARTGLKPTSVERVAANKVLASPRGRAPLSTFLGEGS